MRKYKEAEQHEKICSGSGWTRRLRQKHCSKGNRKGIRHFIYRHRRYVSHRRHGLSEKGINPADEDAVVASLDSLDMKIFPEAGGQRILLDGEDITSRIRTEEIGKAASSVAAYQKVREKLVEIQQGLAKEQSVIMDGRDIGTKVLPDAEVKIYLDASVEERAKRRVGELEAQGKTADLETIREEIAQRDYQDMHRENSPLCRAEDAVNVDTTGLDIPAVTEKLLALIAEKQNEVKRYVILYICKRFGKNLL